MKKECAIVMDLLPLYQEELASPESREFVQEHLVGCESCRGQWTEMQKKVTVPPEVLAPLRDLKKRLRWRKFRIVLASIVVAALLVLLLCIPWSVPYTPDRVSVLANDDGSVTCFIDNRDLKITNYRLSSMDRAAVRGLGLDEGMAEDAVYYCVEARTSLLGWVYNLLLPTGNLEHSPTIMSVDESTVVVYYRQNTVRARQSGTDFVLVDEVEVACPAGETPGYAVIPYQRSGSNG